MELMTKEIEQALTNAMRDQQADQTPIVVKYFTPDAQATWFIVDGEKTDEGDWRLFGFCDLGDAQMAELGYVMLSQIESVRGGLGLKPERDLYFPDTTLRDVLEQYGKAY